MKTYTIVRNGVIARNKQIASAHHCGFATTRAYPYRVELTVTGSLQGPQYFIMANEELDAIVQRTFANRPTVSCERMCDEICHAMLAFVKSQKRFTARHIHVELTGTNGRALLSCDWYADAANRELRRQDDRDRLRRAVERQHDRLSRR